MKKKKTTVKRCVIYGKSCYRHTVSENKRTGLKVYSYIAYKFNCPEKLDKNYCITIQHLYYPDGSGKTDVVNPLYIEHHRRYWTKRND